MTKRVVNRADFDTRITSIGFSEWIKKFFLR